MSNRRALVLSLVLALGGCAVTPAPAKGPKAVHPGFPYHPAVFHLDLSVLAYHVYSQSLVWPFDPYYEQIDEASDRAAAMNKVRKWAARVGREQRDDASVLKGYRGPGVLGSFPGNELHDPIIYSYGRVYPWRECITYPLDRFIVYQTPTRITRRIKDVYVAYRKTGGAETEVVIEPLPVMDEPRNRDPDAGDVLFCFEGGTGGKGEQGQTHSQSLLGCVLLRKKDEGDYDVHIAFRGSRSGSGGRAFLEAFSTRDAQGNPDWITDLGSELLRSETGGRMISGKGRVKRGFARATISTLPCVMACLEKIAELMEGVPPQQVFVTGHSLGGALAQHFVSAILLGTDYGPHGAGRRMPTKLAGWPWKAIKLITFGSPRAGDEEWARTLTVDCLDSEFFSALLASVDEEHLKISDRSIVPRLLDAQRPAAYRLTLTTDPITTEKLGGGGKHVGKSVYLDTGLLLPIHADFDAHEVTTVRAFMTATLADDRIPGRAWRYLSTEEVDRGLTEDEMATHARLNRITARLQDLYLRERITYDVSWLKEDLKLLRAVLSN